MLYAIGPCEMTVGLQAHSHCSHGNYTKALLTQMSNADDKGNSIRQFSLQKPLKMSDIWMPDCIIELVPKWIKVGREGRKNREKKNKQLKS